MSDSVKFQFYCFQEVTIKAVEAKGFVHSRMNNATDINEYKVSFWMDGKRNDDWFFEFELSAA